VKRIIIGSLFFVSFVFSNQIQIKNRVPLSGVAGSNGMVFPQNKSRIVIKNVNVDKDTAYNGDNEVSDPKKRSMKVNMTQFLYRQGLGNNFDVRVILPYVKKENSMTNPRNSKVYDNDNKGLGDIRVIGRYQLLNQMKGDPIFLALGLGVKFPTGDTDKNFTIASGKSKVPTMQIGTGSTDFIGEVGLTKILLNSRIDAHLIYKRNQEGDNNYEFGDSIKWNVGYSYALTNQFDLALTLHGNKNKKNKSNGIKVENTGGNFIYLSPSVHYKINKQFDISLGYLHMLDRDNNFDSDSNMGGLSEDSKFILRLGYNF